MCIFQKKHFQIFGKVTHNGFLPITHLFKTSWTPSPVATPPKSTMPRRSKGSKHGVRIFIFSGPIFFVGSDFFVGPNFFIVILDASGFKTVTIQSGVKNPIQRTTFYLQRRSGARVMIVLCSLKNNGLSFVV